jgi:hypothetical protein
VEGAGEEDSEEGEQGECPEGGEGRPKGSGGPWQSGSGGGHDRGAHHRGVPVGAEVAEGGRTGSRSHSVDGERADCGDHASSVPPPGPAHQGLCSYGGISWGYE